MKELGYEDMNGFLEDTSPEPYGFYIRAFPEFFSNGARPMSIQLHGEPYRVDFTRYLAAYEATYQHHYTMQDEWRVILADPDIAAYCTNFLRYSDPYVISAWVKDWRTRAMVFQSFESFELAMLAVATDPVIDAREWSRTMKLVNETDEPCYLQWIIEWRIKIGRFNPRYDGMYRSPIWRDNWRDVRTAVVAINSKDGNEVKKDDDYWYKTPVEPGASRDDLMALATRIIKERGLRPYNDGDNERLLILRVARAVAEFAYGPWQKHVVQQSGRPWAWSGDEFMF